MKHPRLLPALLAAALAAASGRITPAARAGEASSELHVAMVAPIAAAAAPEQPAVSHLGLPTVPAAVGGGTLTGVGADFVADTAAGYADGQFADPAAPHYVLVTGGLAPGWWARITATEAAGGVLRLDRAPPEALAPGDRYQVRPYRLLGDLLGGPNTGALATAGNPSAADNLLLWDPTQPVPLQTYFVATDGAVYGADYAPAETVAIPPGAGVMARRRGEGATALFVHGVQLGSAFGHRLVPGYNLVSTMRPTGLALDASGLVQDDDEFGLGSGPNFTAADNLLQVAPDGTVAAIFHSNHPAATGFYGPDYAPVDPATVLPGASAFFLHLKGTGDRTWTVPAE